MPRKKTRRKQLSASCSCNITPAQAKAIVRAQNEKAKKGLAAKNAKRKAKGLKPLPYNPATVVGSEVTMAKNGMCMIDVQQKGMRGGMKGRTVKRFLKKASC